MPIKPRRLEGGDCVGIICPASPPHNLEVLDRCTDALQSSGFRVKLGRFAGKRLGFLAGTDRERVADLMGMFSNSAIRAIFCVRGGYGSGRIAQMMDFNLIRANPKIFVGYSDITYLHCALLKRANLVSFHGPL